MQILDSLRNVFRIEELRRRVFFTLAMLVIFRLGSHIPLPEVDPKVVEYFQEQARSMIGGLFEMIQVFSGGALGNIAVFGLGIMPYITASIIMQLMTKVVPSLEAMAKEGPAGQRKISQYTRWLTIPICLFQSLMFVNQVKGMQIGEGGQRVSVFLSAGFGVTALSVLALTAGAMFIMWLGEQISEHGIGNGASVLIMSGIVARIIPITGEILKQKDTIDSVLIVYLIFAAAIVGSVFITQAQRRIPLQHAKHFRGGRMYGAGGRNFLPLRVNTAGVMPVIFASSLFIVPALLGFIPAFRQAMQKFVPGTFLYSFFYILLIVAFAYFWTYMFYDPKEIANNLKEYGSFLPGIRPGEPTAAYVNTILARITLCGAVFLCVIALLPDIVANSVGLMRSLAGFLGGTGILIMVGVCLDLMNKIESHLLLHNYRGFTGSGRAMRGRRV
jgi:preprotein translocase subunit SecY